MSSSFISANKYVWNIATAGFVETAFVVVSDQAACGRVSFPLSVQGVFNLVITASLGSWLEQMWGTREFVKVTVRVRMPFAPS